MQTKEIDGTDFGKSILEKLIVSLVGVDGWKKKASGFSEIMITACDAAYFKNDRLWNPTDGRSNLVFDIYIHAHTTNWSVLSKCFTQILGHVMAHLFETPR